MSLALLAGNIAYEWVYLLRKGEGVEIKRRWQAALGRAPAAMRGTAIVSGESSCCSIVYTEPILLIWQYLLYASRYAPE